MIKPRKKIKRFFPEDGNYDGPCPVTETIDELLAYEEKYNQKLLEAEYELERVRKEREYHMIDRQQDRRERITG